MSKLFKKAPILNSFLKSLYLEKDPDFMSDRTDELTASLTEFKLECCHLKITLIFEVS